MKELKNTIPREPFFFLKPTTSYLNNGGRIEIPRGILAHHEGMQAFVWCCNIFLTSHSGFLTVELGVVIGKTGRNISQAQADKYIAGYGPWCIELSLEDGSQTGTTLQPWQLT